jgi:hypothetical protein
MKALVFAGLLAFAPGAFAVATPPGELVIPNERIEPKAFPEFAQSIKTQMEPGQRFEFVTEKERITVERSLDDMVRILAGHESLGELKEEDKIKLINAQSQANAILNHRDRDRLICERRILVGSHFPETVCETYGEKVTRTEAARKRVREMEQRKLPKVDRGGAGA